MKTRLDKLVIKRSKWLRGTKKGILLNISGKMCCLGFYCKELGVEDDDMFERLTPATVLGPTTALTKKGITGTHNSSLSSRAMAINDNSSITDEQREKELKELFTRNNTEVEFVD